MTLARSAPPALLALALASALAGGCRGGSLPEIVGPRWLAAGGTPAIDRVVDLGARTLPVRGPLVAENRDGRAVIGDLLLLEGSGFGKQPEVAIGGRSAGVLLRVKGGGVVVRVPWGIDPGDVPIVVANGFGEARATFPIRRLAVVVDGAALRWFEVDAAGEATPKGAVPLAARLLAITTEGSVALAAGAGAAGAATAWVLYGLVVSGYPLPNTWYIKGGGGGVSGLRYLAEEVLPFQPWLVSLTGVVLLGLALARRGPVRVPLLALVGAASATWLAIALDRPLQVGVQFYQSRYFAPFGWPFGLAVALGLGHLRRRAWAAVALAPLAALVGLQGADRYGRTRALQADTAATHTAVARDLARRARPGDVVGVEGAGAARYFAPRTVTILDLVGLNDRVAAHLHFDRTRKLCHFVARRPALLAIPAPWVPLFAPPFRVRALAHFDDPAYSQVLPPRPHRVEVLQVLSVTPAWQTRCARLGYGAAQVSP